MTSSSTIKRALRGALLCAVALWVLQVAPDVRAEPEAFKASYAAGKTALQSGAFQEAVDRFRESLRSAGEDKVAGWKGMIGVAYAFRGLERPDYALEYYRRFLKAIDSFPEGMLPPKWRARRDAVQAEVAELESAALQDHALVMVVTTPPGAQLSVDGLPAGADGDAVTPFPLYLRPGSHTITIALPNHEVHTHTLEAVAGVLVPLNLTLTPIAVEAPPPAPAPAPEAQPVETEDNAGGELQLPAVEEEGSVGGGPYVVMGVGGAAVLTAVGLTVGATLKHQDYEQRHLYYETLDAEAQKALTGDEARSAVAELDALARSRDELQLAANVLYAVGIGAAIGGVIWMLVADGPEEDAATASRWVPMVGIAPLSEGALTSATWRF